MNKKKTALVLLFSVVEFNLTEREIDVVQCAANGMSIKETGGHLFISPSTVEGHRIRAIEKMGVANITEAVSVAIRNHLIK